MEPLESEAETGRNSRYGNHVRRSGAHESLLLTDPRMRPGGGHPGRGTGPHAPARQRYPGGTAPQWPAVYPAASNQPAGPYRNGNGDSVSVAARILSVADYEAASITQQASLQAAMITQRVTHQATEIREAARREADRLMQQASLQAAAVREEAEIQAAEVHTAVMSMQTELSELAERIRNTFPHPVLPPDAPRAVGPAARPAIGPSTHPPTGPKARPRTGPQERAAGRAGTRPRTGPRERLAGKPAARAAGMPQAQSAEKSASAPGRQGAAMRLAVIATCALFLVAVVAGVMEVHLHGWKFFIFRSVGTGETGRGPGGLQENQGPGQPDAPTATPSQVKVQPSPRSTVTVRSGH